RIHSHLLWLGLAGHYIGYHTVWMWSWKYRELVCDLFERLTGNRQSYAMMKPGGVRQDIKPSEYKGIVAALDELEPKINMFIGAVLDDPVILARLRGVGKMSREDAVKRCTVGPVARSADVDIDVRRDYPYAAYSMVDWKVIVQSGGDVMSMAVVRLLECLESVKIIRQCVDQIPEGPILEEIAEVPVGEGIGTCEAPRGECFHYVRSDGNNTPYRLKVRAPTYSNLPSFRSRFLGERVADIMIILASIDPCYCCTNRVVRIDDGRTIQSLDEKSLLEMSWQRTKELDARYAGRSRRLLEL
ncbi:MAG: NADH:ubiquinone oxidoreductase, partial [Dehalococcoidia bacterium]|nr:NADH:ubiquinone oxidoreductase [Dehalococcoidia bacterium]